MSFDELVQLIRKYLSTGIAVVVILSAPAADHDPALPGRPEVVTIEPGPLSAGWEKPRGPVRPRAGDQHRGNGGP